MFYNVIAGHPTNDQLGLRPARNQLPLFHKQDGLSKNRRNIT